MSDSAVAAVLERRAALFEALAKSLAALAESERELAAALDGVSPARRGAVEPDQVLSLPEAAALVGLTPEGFRRKGEFFKARVSAPGEHRARYSRRALERVLADRLAANGS